MSNINLGFDPQAVRKAINKEPWEADHEADDGEIRRMYLGSVQALYPSGKIYTPFACGNLNPCPVCSGSGITAPPYKRRLITKWRNRCLRTRRLLVKRYWPCPCDEWPAKARAISTALRSLEARLPGHCTRCAGSGSHEAADDERWHRLATTALDACGLYLDEDSGDVFVAESRAKTAADEDRE